MNKIVIIINGSGGVGKDTLCNITSRNFECLNISSVDEIKDIASLYTDWHSNIKEPKDIIVYRINKIKNFIKRFRNG